MTPSLLAIACCALTFSLRIPSPEESTPQVQTYPALKAHNVNPDLQLRLTFNDLPRIGDSGQIRIYDASTRELVDLLDISIPSGPTERRTGDKPPYTPEPYVYGPSNLTNANSKAGTPSGLASPTPDDYQLTIIGGFTDGFHFRPIIVRGNTATIYLHHNLLAYGKSYYVEIDPGVLWTSAGRFSGFSGPNAWTFSTKYTAPSLDSGKLTVDASGNGDFNTIQGAIDFVPDNHPEQIEIFIHSGRYEEIVYFRNKTNLRIRGEDRERTIITYENREVFNPHPENIATNEWPGTFPSRRAAFMADNCQDLIVENLTIHNTAVRAQAEGLLVNGSRNAFRNVTIIGSGDALQSNGSAYYENCRIEGWGDTILGRGPSFFKDCTLVSTGPYMWIRNTDQNHGNVFVDCTFDTPEGHETVIARSPSNKGRTYPFAEAVLINCKLNGIAPEGWGRIDGDVSNLRFWEYNSTVHGTCEPADTGMRHPHSRQLTLPDDAQILKNYSNPEWVLDGWMPVF